MIFFVNPALKEQIESAASPSKALARGCLWVCSVLYLKAADDRDDVRRCHKYFPLLSTTIRDNVTARHYSDVFATLLALRAIEVWRDGAYMSSSYAAARGTEPKSKQYRLAAKFRTGVVPVEVEAVDFFTRIDRQATKASFAGMKGTARRWVIESYRDATFAPDAADILAARPFKTPDARTRAQNNFANITEQRLRFIVCNKSGRVYYPVASLPKVLRQKLLLNGEETVELDIAASQPTLLATLYKNDCEERLTYLAEVQDPKFYERFALAGGKDWDRDRSKEQFFNQIAYGCHWNRASYELLPAFEKRFSILSGEMTKYKVQGNDKLPIEMQKREATIAIDGACGECAERGIKVLPVHDSLIVKKSDAETVHEIFARHWLQVTGIPARIKPSDARVAAA